MCIRDSYLYRERIEEAVVEDQAMTMMMVTVATVMATGLTDTVDRPEGCPTTTDRATQ